MTARTKPPFKADIVGIFSRSEELVDIISIDAAQPKLDLSVLRRFRSKRMMLGILDLGNTETENPELILERAVGSSWSRRTSYW